jgi:hypothetical protein
MQLNKASLSCNAIFSLIVLCLVIITFPSTDRLKYDDLDNTVLATNLPIIRHRDPLRIHVDKGHIPDLLEVGVATATFNKHEVRNFVDSHVLQFHEKATSADAKKFFEAVASRHLTPLQVSMMLMGCYGYVYSDGHHGVTNVKSTFDILTMTTSWNEYTTAFLLQGLETKNAISANHDRSSCSCMKDFANPTILKLKDDEDVLDMATNDLLQDTCMMQNTIDYTLDGAGAALVGKAPTDLKKSVMFETMAGGDVSKRQRQDQLTKRLELAKTATCQGAVTIDVHKKGFIDEYCKLVADCPTLWKTNSATVTNTQFFDELISRVGNVMPHNKLRPPQVCANHLVFEIIIPLKPCTTNPRSFPGSSCLAPVCAHTPSNGV